MKLGSLFSGYGGLDMAVMEHFGASLEWYAEFDKAPSAIMAAHHPGIPNFGDVTKIDWINVPDIDILTGGYPCQPFSHAGLRKGTNDARHLWPYVREAISHLRPRIVVLENVRGHLTLGFDTVLAEITDLGYDAQWSLVRASDVGAPHQRARLFIVAYPNSPGLQGHDRTASSASTGRHGYAEQSIRTSAAYPASYNSQGWKEQARREVVGINAASNADGDGYGQPLHARRMGGVESNTEGEALERQRTRGESDSGSPIAWGKYEPAIRRWESITRPAPAPTIPGTDGRPRLNPVFVEWMMGLPDGWVSNHDLTWTAQLKMLGNGVVPQQAKYALELLT